MKKIALVTVAVGLAFLAGTQINRPTLTRTNNGWILQHVAMPGCPDDHRRTVDIPERDEVDALTVSCLAYSSYTAPHSHFHNGKLPKAPFSHCYTPDDVRAHTVTASVPCVTIDN